MLQCTSPACRTRVQLQGNCTLADAFVGTLRYPSWPRQQKRRRRAAIPVPTSLRIVTIQAACAIVCGCQSHMHPPLPTRRPVFANFCGVRCHEQRQKSCIPAPADTFSIAAGRWLSHCVHLDCDAHGCLGRHRLCLLWSLQALHSSLTLLTKSRLSNTLWGSGWPCRSTFNECTGFLRDMISNSNESNQFRKKRRADSAMALTTKTSRIWTSDMSTLDDGSLKPNQRQDYRDE